MSRTKRKDYYVEAFGEPLFDKDWKATSDKKKWYKPNKGYKKCQRKKDSVKPKQRFKEAIKHGDDWDNVVIEDPKRHDTWDWN